MVTMSVHIVDRIHHYVNMYISVFMYSVYCLILSSQIVQYIPGNSICRIWDSNGNILHFGTLPDYIPNLIYELLEWVKTSKIHMLIKSCVFHYEFELIHPFADGNGRIGRLWHTLLLSKWNPVFAWLPIESIIHDNQKAYYEAINTSNDNGESTIFIEFMLTVIKQALLEASEYIIPQSVKNNKYLTRLKIIDDYLKTHEYIMNSSAQQLLGVSSATATRI